MSNPTSKQMCDYVLECARNGIQALLDRSDTKNLADEIERLTAENDRLSMRVVDLERQRLNCVCVGFGRPAHETSRCQHYDSTGRGLCEKCGQWFMGSPA